MLVIELSALSTRCGVFGVKRRVAPGALVANSAASSVPITATP